MGISMQLGLKFKKNRVLFALLALSFLMLNCGDLMLDDLTDSRSKKGAGQTPRDSSTGTGSAYVSNLQFGFFDPLYDFSAAKKFNVQQLSQRFPVYSGTSSVSLLGSGHDFLSARLKLLDQVKKSVRIQTLVFQGDESGWTVANKLIELKKRGIDVRVMVDSISNLFLASQSLYHWLEQNEIHVEGYEPLYMFALNRISAMDSIDDIMQRTNQRQHEKIFVIDAELPNEAQAIIGGSNISNKYFRISTDIPLDTWRDKDVMIKGPAACDVAEEFDFNMQEYARFKQERALFNTDILWNISVYIRDVLKLSSPTTKEQAELNPKYIQTINQVYSSALNLYWKSPIMRYLHNRPQYKEEYIHEAYLDFIRSTKQDIVITNAYFLPTTDFRETLKNAARRGIKVRILTNAKEVSDFPTVMVAARTLYKDLLQVNSETGITGNIDIYEWSGHPIFKNGEGLHHAKYAIFDRKAVIIGSHNIDPRSKNLDSENMVAFEDEELAARQLSEFEADIGPNFSRKISLAEAILYTDPDNILQKLQTTFMVDLIPLL